MGTMRPFSSCADHCGNVVAMIKFMCQLDLAMGFPDIWPSISPDMSMTMYFLDDTNM